MIISHKYKFIFVKNRKVAGSSLQACIGKHCGRSDIFTVSGDIPSQNTKGVWNPCGEMKSKVYLDAYEGINTVTELVKEYGVHPTQISAYHQLLNNLYRMVLILVL